ncbi:zinc finger, CCHC-type containing protein [Tanacetum coccineum]
MKEVDIGLDGGRDKPLCPADMLLYSWDGGLDVCVDLIGSSPLTQTGMVDFVPGRAVFDDGQRKRDKYMAKCAAIRYGFLPFSFSSLGELEADAITLLKRIRKFSMAQDIGARVAVHIFNMISFAIAKGRRNGRDYGPTPISLKIMFSAAGDGITSSTRRRHNSSRDGVTTFHDGVSSERTRLHLFQFSLRDQASNWLERLPAGSITTWEDLTTRFLAQFFPPRRTAKLRNDILMFQQHHGESLSEAWTQIIENLAFYDHEGWNDTKVFAKPVKAISKPQGTSKTPKQRLLELEDQINFLLKGSRLAPTLSSTHTPQSYVKAVYLNSHPQNQPPKLNLFAFRERIDPNPQPQALRTTFEARVRDYMAAHTEQMERFENSIFKQREEINGKMTEMFGLLKELTTSRAPKKVLIREEAKSPVTKSVNSISPIREEEEKSDICDVAPGDDSKETDKPDMEVSHRINEKLIEGLVDNNRFNDSLSGARAGKKKGKTYNVLPRGPVYEVILKKNITKKEYIGGNFEIPCSIRGLKHVNALVDQGSDVNFMPYSTYMKLTDEMPAETEIKLSLASHSYIYPLGIAEDVLVEIAKHVYPVDFVILDIKEDKKRPFILGTPFLTTAKAVIKFDKGTITLRSGKSKISFHRIPKSPGMIERGVKNNIEPIAPTMTVNRLVLEWKRG